MRGDNFRNGSKDGDVGRRLGSPLGGKATASRPAPPDCEHCRTMGYDSWMQHIGHLGFRAVMVDYPEALHAIQKKVQRTGRPSTAARYKLISS